MPQVSGLGIDMAKQLFHIVGMDDTMTTVWRKPLTRSVLMSLISQIPPWSSGWKPVEEPRTGSGAFINMGIW